MVRSAVLLANVCSMMLTESPTSHCCRCADIPHSERSKRSYSCVLAIIPGPKEPSNMEPYLEPMVEELRLLGPEGGLTSACAAHDAPAMQQCSSAPTA
jgi:hypothetical protein